MKTENNFLVNYIVYCFKISTGNQCFQYCIQMTTLLSLVSFIKPASLIAKCVDQQKSKIVKVTIAIGTSLMDTGGVLRTP
jgi:hypothetical protein